MTGGMEKYVWGNCSVAIRICPAVHRQECAGPIPKSRRQTFARWLRGMKMEAVGIEPTSGNTVTGMSTGLVRLLHLALSDSGGQDPGSASQVNSRRASLGAEAQPAGHSRRPHPTRQAGSVRTGRLRRPVRRNIRLHLHLFPNSLTSFWDARPAIQAPSTPVETCRPPRLVRLQGLEPRTNGLRVRCSTS